VTETSVDDALTLVLFVVAEPLRHVEPTFAVRFDLGVVEENPYRLIKLWWSMPASFRQRMVADGLDALAFQSAVLGLYREQRVRMRSGRVDGELSQIVPVSAHVCACTMLAGGELAPAGAVAVDITAWAPSSARRIGA
jgi:hypothetical protein